MGTSKFKGINQIPYDKIKDEIKAGDILFCNGRYLVSELIKKVSNSLFSHVALLFFWEERIFVLESVEDHGVRALPLSHYCKNFNNSNKKYNGELYVARHTMLEDLDPNKKEILFEQAINLINRNYDKDEIAKIVARIGLNLGKHTDDTEYICSEFVDECFKKINIEFPRDATGFIFPEHIAADINVKPLFEIV